MSRRLSLLGLAREHPWIFALTAVLAGVGMWQSEKESRAARESRVRPLLVELDEFLRVPLQEIRVIPVFSSSEDFAYSIDTPDQLARFRALAQRADAKQVSGHSGEVFEADLILENAERQIRFLATVHKREPLDLFLGRRNERRNPDGSFWSDAPVRVRVPGLGEWMMGVAPYGSLDRGASRPCPEQSGSQTSACASPAATPAPPG